MLRISTNIIGLTTLLSLCLTSQPAWAQSAAKAWGSNGNGQLGNNTTTNSPIPVQVSGLTTDVTLLRGGYSHSVVMKNDGTVWAWGQNDFGQTGAASPSNQLTPVQVPNLTGIIAVASGAESQHNLALKNDGTVWAWGRNNFGQLGDGTTSSGANPTPVQVSGLTGIVGIAKGTFHSLALKNDGTVWAWGYNASGQLGNTLGTIQTSPTQISGLTRVTAISAGVYHSLALRFDGTLRAWGYNAYGQLGDGSTNDSFTPVPVVGVSGVVAVAAGNHFTLALNSDGTVQAWGSNNNGQLGNNSTVDTGAGPPVFVSGLTNAIAIAAGGFHALALKADATVSAWGSNLLGQLGNGTQISSTTPVPVSNLTGVTRIDAGSYHSLALVGSTPATLVALTSKPQSTPIGTQFTNQLSALVRDAAGSPLFNTPVTFTAPATGASATFTNGLTSITISTNSEGRANAIATANSTIGGPYNVTASVPGLASVNFPLTNLAPAATVLLTDLKRAYTGSPLSPTVTTTPANIATTLTGAPQTAVGSYPVTATVTDPNYSGSASGTFLILKARSTITFTGAGTFPYDGQAHAVTAIVTGPGLNQPLTVTYSGTCSAAPVTVAEGASCTVSASYDGDDNHSPASDSTSIVIDKANASVIINGNSKFFGTPDPSPLTTGTLSGFVASDNISVTYERLPGESVAKYAISAILSPAGPLPNYKITVTTSPFIILPDTTSLTYTGATSSAYGQCGPTILSAVLMDTVHNVPVSGRTVTFTVGTQSFDAVTDALGVATVSTTLTQGAGNVTVQAVHLGTPPYASSSSAIIPFSIGASTGVGPVPGAAIYSGPTLLWTASPTSNTATATLSATIKDLGVCNADIRTAKVTFAIRTATGYSPIPSAQNLPVGLVSPTDGTVGTASAIVNLNTGNGTFSQYQIAVILTGNYTFNDPSTDTLLTVAKPGQASSMVAGGTLDLLAAPRAAGYLATGVPDGIPGYLCFVAGVTYNKSGSNLQGGVQLLVRTFSKPNGTIDTVKHTYLIKSTSIAGLVSPAPGTLSFSGKAVVQDITNPAAPVSVDGGASLQITTVNATSGNNGYVNVQVIPKAGGLWLAAGWDGTRPQPKQLYSGSIVGQ